MPLVSRKCVGKKKTGGTHQKCFSLKGIFSRNFRLVPRIDNFASIGYCIADKLPHKYKYKQTNE